MLELTSPEKTHVGGICDEKGNHIGKSFKIDNSVEGFENLLKKLAQIDVNISQFVFGMEATGHYWLNLYTWLCDRNFTVHVINPLQSDALRKLQIRKTKTDSIDAYLIAECIRLGKYCDTHLADEDMLALRELTRQRFYLVDMASDIKRKVIAMMDRIFPEYESLFSDMFGKTSRDLLKEYTTPEDILAVDTVHLAEILRKSSKGRFKAEKAEELKKTAANSFAVLLSSQTTALLVKQMIEQIELLESQIAEIEKIIEKRYSTFDCKLTKIPGMGITLAAAIFSEIGDISRFPDPKQLTAFAGLDPVLKQSGTNKGLGYHISKRGSPYLRRALWLAAHTIKKWNPSFAYAYRKKLDSGKNKTQALAFLSHKLLNVVFTVLKNNIDYLPIFPSDVDVSKLTEKAFKSPSQILDIS